ncbi:MAG TPA: hypothetical protein VNX28_10545 [Gemmataceae bacterium]|nr:hypothetical protein [Gemmataceae bacterium]
MAFTPFQFVALFRTVSHPYWWVYWWAPTNGPGRRQGPRTEHFGHAADGLGVLIREQMPVGVHGERDRRMTHDLPDHARMNALDGQPGAARVPHGVEVEGFPLVVFGHQEIALLTPCPLVWVVLYLIEPTGASCSQVSPEH